MLDYEKLRFEARTKNLAQERVFNKDEEERLFELFTIAQSKKKTYFAKQETMEVAFTWFKVGYKLSHKWTEK